MSLLIWPILSLIYTYYTYLAFDFHVLKNYGINTRNDFLIFLITGNLILNCFLAMVQSGFFLTFERENGTMETFFTTPVHKIFLLYGRALGGFIANLWIYLFYSVVLFIINGDFSLIGIGKNMLIFVIILLASTIWGGFINILFFVSRDCTHLFTLTNIPMEFFSGAIIPVKAFPVIGQIIAGIFPVTYCLQFIRSVFFHQVVPLKYLILFVISLILMITLSIIFLSIAEKRYRRQGSIYLY
jgi:ABC-2 type transport system permease protein